MNTKPEKQKYSAPAAKAALEMLELMTKDSRSYSLSEIVDKLGITTNSAFRIFKELELKGYVIKDSTTSSYELTPKIYYLGNSIKNRISFVKAAQPYMKQIKRFTKETVLLTKFDTNNDTLVVDQLESAEPIKFMSTVGVSYDSYCSAMGKAMLSTLDEEELADYLCTHELAKKTESTITNREKLIQELFSIRLSQVAYDRGENLEGLTCIASPVFSSFGNLAGAIGISGLSFRMPAEQIEEYSAFIKDQAKQLSNTLGYA